MRKEKFIEKFIGRHLCMRARMHFIQKKRTLCNKTYVNSIHTNAVAENRIDSKCLCLTAVCAWVCALHMCNVLQRDKYNSNVYIIICRILFASISFARLVSSARFFEATPSLLFIHSTDSSGFSVIFFCWSTSAIIVPTHQTIYIIMNVESSNSREYRTILSFTRSYFVCVCMSVFKMTETCVSIQTPAHTNTWPHFANNVLMLCLIFTHTIEPFEGKPFAHFVALWMSGAARSETENRRTKTAKKRRSQQNVCEERREEKSID